MTTPEIFEEQRMEQCVRPRFLKDYIGQNSVHQQMSIFFKAALQRRQALDHVLIFGPPGLGKTTLAHIIATEMGVHLKHTSGPVLEKAGDLAALLTHLEPFDVLFIDEIHRLNPAIEEILYPAMEDYQLDLLIGEGPAARSVKLDLPPFTLVGATTRSGLLTAPLRDRFGILQRLEFYTAQELARVVARSAQILEIDAHAEATFEIARRSRGTPRIANRLLRRVRDVAEVCNQGILDYQTAQMALELLHIDQFGFESMDRKYLQLLMEQFSGGPVGINSISAALGETADTVEEVIEPYLIQEGYIARTARGRIALDLAHSTLESRQKILVS